MFDILSRAKAKDLMRREVLTLSEDKTVADAAGLMSKHNRGYCLVLNAVGELAGIFTERDLVRRTVADNQDARKLSLKKVMTTNIIQAQAEESAIHLLDIMCSHNFRHIPILDGKKILGIVSIKHFYQFFLEKRESWGV